MFLLFTTLSHASLTVARCSYRFGTVAMETTGLPACIDRTRQRWEKVVRDWIPWPPNTPHPTQQHLFQGQSVTLYYCQHIVRTFCGCHIYEQWP